jgi:hypothetical protein
MSSDCGASILDTVKTSPTAQLYICIKDNRCHFRNDNYEYCHGIEWLYTGFGLMVGYIGFFDTARDYSLQFIITHTRARVRTSVHCHVFTSRYSVAASNGWCFPSSGFPNYPRPQLPASNSNRTQRLNRNIPLTHYLANQLFTPLTDSQAGDHLTQTSYSSSWPPQESLTCPAYNTSALPA